MSYVPRGPAAARAQAFRRCAGVVAVHAQIYSDNHFVWEACAAGVRPVAHWSGAPVQGDSLWSDAQRNQALERFQTAEPSVPVPEVVDWQTIPAYLQAVVPTKVTTAPTPTFKAGAHSIRLYSSLAEFTQANTKPSAGVLPAVILFPDKQQAWDPVLHSQLNRYHEIYIDISEGTAFFLGAITEILSRSVQSIDQFEPTLHRLLQQTRSVALDIVHMGSDASLVQQHSSLLSSLQERWQSGGAGHAPTVLVHTQKPFSKTGPSGRRIGIGVATDAIVNGLASDAQGRYQLRWLSRKPTGSERGRVYFYPLSLQVGLDQDETDYASLPALLQQNKIDMLCSVDPYLSGSISARILWAQKAIPVVGMLHSVHTASAVTDAVFQLTCGPSQPFDVIISPSRCGAEAYQGLLDHASEWLGKISPAPPRYAGSVEVIPYGIDTSHYDGLHKPACRLALDLPQEALILLSFGRFSRQEKADLVPLLLAFQKVHAMRPEALLVVAGGARSDGYVNNLRGIVGKLGLGGAVHFCEDVDGSDKVLYYGAADIFVAASDNIQETYGLTLLEAMAAGLPTIAPAWDGYREIIREGKTGMLIPTYRSPMPTTSEHVLRIAESIVGYGHRDLHESVVVDPEAWVAAMATLMRNPGLRAAMGEAGRATCRSDYEQATQSRRIGDLLLDRVTMAAKSPWPVTSPLAPYHDPVGARFAHYPSGGNVAPQAALAMGPWGAEPQQQAAIIDSLGIASRQEVALIRGILDKVAQTPHITLHTLAHGFDNSPYTPEQISARAVRCLKYGLLRLEKP